MAPGTESLNQNHAGDPFQAFALDLWNGSVAQCNNFIASGGITYPLLRNAGSAGIGGLYSTGHDVSFVIDGDGVVVYRGNGFNASAVNTAVDAALANLVSAVGDLPAAKRFELKPAYPNPFNPTTNIAWAIGSEVAAASVQVDVLDLRGRRVARLLDEIQAGGTEHAVQWDGRDAAGSTVPSGTYLAAVTVDGVQRSRTITLVK